MSTDMESLFLELQDSHKKLTNLLIESRYILQQCGDWEQFPLAIKEHIEKINLETKKLFKQGSHLK